MPPTPKANKSTNETLFNEIDPSAQVSTIKDAAKSSQPVELGDPMLPESRALIDTYAVPILIELIKHEMGKRGLGNHEALAAHAFRYARAALIERGRPFKPTTVAVAQGVPTQQPAAPATVELPPPAPAAPNPLAPELPPGMSAATPDELRELMRG